MAKSSLALVEPAENEAEFAKTGNEPPRNVRVFKCGDKMLVEVDMSLDAYKTAEPSRSGKTLTVGSTHGIVTLDDTFGTAKVFLNLNVNVARSAV